MLSSIHYPAVQPYPFSETVSDQSYLTFNRCVFDGIQPSLNSVLVSVKDEFLLWSLAGARGISNLLALEPANV